MRQHVNWPDHHSKFDAEGLLLDASRVSNSFHRNAVSRDVAKFKFFVLYTISARTFGTIS